MDVQGDKAIVDLKRYNQLLEMEKNIGRTNCVPFYKFSEGMYGISSFPTRQYMTNDEALKEASEINSAMSKDVIKVGSRIASLKVQLEESEKVVLSFHSMNLYQFFMYKFFTKAEKDE